MQVKYSLVALLLAGIGSSTPAQRRAVEPLTNFNNNGVFYPSKEASDWRSIYARTLQLPDKSLILTWEDYDPTANLTYWPIYKSTDGGASFKPFSRVKDQVNGWGNWYNPHLYELSQDIGGRKMNY